MLHQFASFPCNADAGFLIENGIHLSGMPDTARYILIYIRFL